MQIVTVSHTHEYGTDTHTAILSEASEIEYDKLEEGEPQVDWLCEKLGIDYTRPTEADALKGSWEEFDWDISGLDGMRVI